MIDRKQDYPGSQTESREKKDHPSKLILKCNTYACWKYYPYSVIACWGVYSDITYGIYTTIKTMWEWKKRTPKNLEVGKQS